MLPHAFHAFQVTFTFPGLVDGCETIDYIRFDPEYVLELSNKLMSNKLNSSESSDSPTEITVFKNGHANLHGVNLADIKSYRFYSPSPSLWKFRHRIANFFQLSLVGGSCGTALKTVRFGTPYDCTRTMDTQIVPDQFDCVRSFFSTHDKNARTANPGCGWVNISSWNVQVEGGVNVVPSWLYTDSMGWVLAAKQFATNASPGAGVVFASSYGNPLAAVSGLQVDYCDGVLLSDTDVSTATWSYSAQFVNC